MANSGSDAHSALLSRRVAIGGGLLLSVLGAGAVGFAAQTGRLPILTPELPENVSLPAVDGVLFEGKPVRGIHSHLFEKSVIVFNVWASWCPNCRAEHAQLLSLAQEPGLCIFGVAIDDTEANVRAYLNEAGNPYSHLSVDKGRVFQRAFKQRGIPTSTVFRQDKTFAHRIIGEVTQAKLRDELKPAVDRARLRA